MKTKLTHFAVRLLPAFLIFLAVASNGQVTNQTTMVVYATIQAAVDDAAPGDILSVAPGVYVESIIVDEEVTIQGPKAGIDGNDPSRGTGEAIILPPEKLFGDGTYNGGFAMRITTDNVIVDGLTFDGDNPAIASEYYASTGGYDIDFGIMSYWSPWYDLENLAGNNLIIRNNIIKNNRLSAIVFSAGFNALSASSSILHNKIQNSTGYPAINLGNNYFANVEYNTIVDTYIGIQASWYYVSNPENTLATIKHNTISSRSIILYDSYWGETGVLTDVKGIAVHMVYNGVNNSWEISDNTLSNSTVRSAGSRGLFFNINWTPTSLIISNNNVNGFETGYNLKNNGNSGTGLTPPTESLAIAGGTVSNCAYGVLATNLSEYYGLSQSALYEITGLTLLNNTSAGFFINDESSNPVNTNPSSVNVIAVNCIANNNETGLLLSGEYAFATAHDNDLSDNGSFAINNPSPNEVDASCNWFGHWSGPAAEGNPSGIGSAVSGAVIYSPWLTSGEDVLADPGFQSEDGSCIDIQCGQNDDKFKVCHKGHNTICIAFEDVEDHLAHGDSFGDCATKSSEIPEELVVKIFPNPSNSQFNLSFESPSMESIEVDICDIIGRTLKHFSLENGHSYLLGEELMPGIYCLRVQQGSEARMIKVIKK